ncbi:MAG TPA: hypothetical protein PKK77_09720, partial [bacterium]|nr:hypothetical protein [bacterium]
ALFLIELLFLAFILVSLVVGIRNYYTEKANFIGMIFFNVWILVGFSMVVFLSLKHFYDNRASA